MLDEFRVAHYVIEIEARQVLLLPEYKGSMLRGAFGHAFRRLCCDRRQETCKDCPIRENCPYFYIFEAAFMFLNTLLLRNRRVGVENND